MIDTTSETVVRLTQAGRVINPQRPPSLASLWRWCGKGVRNHRLESVVLGGIRHTSQEAIQRFITSLNKPGDVPEPPPTARAKAAGERLAKRLSRK